MLAVTILIDADHADPAVGDVEDQLMTLATDAALSLDLPVVSVTVAPVAQPYCPRCGSDWGGDETCGHCTDDDGNARPLP